VSDNNERFRKMYKMS